MLRDGGFNLRWTYCWCTVLWPESSQESLLCCRLQACGAEWRRNVLMGIYNSKVVRFCKKKTKRRAGTNLIHHHQADVVQSMCLNQWVHQAMAFLNRGNVKWVLDSSFYWREFSFTPSILLYQELQLNTKTRQASNLWEIKPRYITSELFPLSIWNYNV